MNVLAIYNAIATRLQADTGSGGLFNATSALVFGLFNNYASGELFFPLLVVDVGIVNDDAFASDILEVTIIVHTFTAASFAAVDNYSSILDRIYGNAVQQSGRVPTYGLHRWSMTLSGGWTASPLHQVDMRQLPSEDEQVAYHFIQTFKTIVSRTASSP